MMMTQPCLDLIAEAFALKPDDPNFPSKGGDLIYRLAAETVRGGDPYKKAYEDVRSIFRSHYDGNDEHFDGLYATCLQDAEEEKRQEDLRAAEAEAAEMREAMREFDRAQSSAKQAEEQAKRPEQPEEIKAGRRPNESSFSKLLEKNADEIIPPSVSEPWPDDPPDLTYVPGVVGEMIDHIVASSRLPDRKMALAAALATASATLNRKVVGPTNGGTVLYVLILAWTGAGKEHLLNCAEALMGAAGEKAKMGPTDLASVQAIQELAIKQPSCFCVMDEFGGFLARISHGSQCSNVQEITSILSSLWGKPPGSIYRSAKKMSKEVEEVFWPNLGILGASTPAQFYQGIKNHFIASGFINRFLIISVGKGGDLTKPQRNWSEVSQALIARLKKMAGSEIPFQLQMSFGIKPQWRKIGWGEGAEILFEEFENRNRNRPDGTERDIWIRAADMALRLATIVAVGRFSTNVSKQDMAWAIEVVSNSATKLFDDLQQYSREQLQFGDLCDKVIDFIRRSGGHAPREKILNALRGHIRGKREAEDALAYLSESKQIVIGTVGDVVIYTLVGVR
jgi:hypothetical protein